MRTKLGIAAAMIGLVGAVALLVDRGAGTPAAAAETKPVAAPSAPQQKGPPWAKACGKDGQGTELCFVQQFAIAEPQKLVLLQVRVGYLGPNAVPRLILATPLGVLLPPGVTITLDQEKPLMMPFGSCQQDGCLAIADLDADALKRITGGKVLAVRYMAAENKPIDIPVQLAGLADALKAVAPKKK
jgi:invasion protein IalB